MTRSSSCTCEVSVFAFRGSSAGEADPDSDTGVREGIGLEELEDDDLEVVAGFPCLFGASRSTASLYLTPSAGSPVSVSPVNPIPSSLALSARAKPVISLNGVVDPDLLSLMSLAESSTSRFSLRGLVSSSSRHIMASSAVSVSSGFFPKRVKKLSMVARVRVAPSESRREYIST